MSVGQMRWKLLDDPDKRLAHLKRAVRNRIMRKAARAGAAEVRKEAKRHAPKGESGTLKASISVRISTNKRTGAVYAIVGPRRGLVRKKSRGHVYEDRPSKRAHLIEKGTRPHWLAKGGAIGVARRVGRHPGAKANPFLKRAWMSSHSRAVSRMRQVIAQELANLGTAGGGATDAGE